jgi:hypothetical protein
VAANLYPSGFSVPVIVPVSCLVPVVFGRYALSAPEHKIFHEMPIFVGLSETGRASVIRAEKRIWRPRPELNRRPTA